MEQKKKAALMLIAAALVLAVLVIWGQAKKAPGQEEEPGNVYVDVPDGDVPELSSSKSTAYMTSSASNNIEDYWNDCEDEYASLHEDEQGETGISQGSSSTSQATAQDLFGKDVGTVSKQSAGGSNPYRESARDREARHQKRREEAIELADRMSGKDKEGSSAESAHEEPRSTIILPSNEVRRSDVISSLDNEWSDGGVSSLDENRETVTSDDTHPFKCMFVREEKIKNGQRVSVRLLEDIVVGGILIPKNSHLMASCSISSRLDLEIANVEMQGRILVLGYEAYDTDGTRGIYCPDVGTTGKTVRSKGTSLAGTALTSRVGRLASDVVSTGVSLIESATGERTVTVPAGYTFFIVKKKQ